MTSSGGSNCALATRLVLFTPERDADRVGTFLNGSLACDNAEATWLQLSAKGIEFVEPPTV